MGRVVSRGDLKGVLALLFDVPITFTTIKDKRKFCRTIYPELQLQHCELYGASTPKEFEDALGRFDIAGHPTLMVHHPGGHTSPRLYHFTEIIEGAISYSAAMQIVTGSCLKSIYE